MNGLGRHEDEDESRFSPIDARRAIALLPRLPRSFGVAGALDGRGKGSSSRPKTCGILHAFPPSPRRVRPVEKDHPKPCRQYVAARRRDHPRRERKPFSEKGVRSEYFMPFLLHLAGSGLSKRTIQNHVDNMWLLGGEIIRDVNENPSLRKVAAEKLVRAVIHEEGGPLIHNGWEDEQRTFDSTCRKFYRFLTQPQR